MKQSIRSVKKTIRELRKIIDNPQADKITTRLAYFTETALRWSIEDTVGWKRPEEELFDEAEFLKKELGLKS